MNSADYARMVEECSRQAEKMQPGPERDALLEKVRQYRSYAKMDNWVASNPHVRWIASWVAVTPLNPDEER